MRGPAGLVSGGVGQARGVPAAMRPAIGYPRRMERFHATYEEPHDSALVRKLNADGMRANWIEWYYFGLKSGAIFLLISVPTWLISSYYAQKYVSEGLWISSAFTIFVGLMFPVYSYVRAIDKHQMDPYEGELWQCSMDDERWTSRSRNGLVLSIPWELMKLTYEHPEGWAIEYGHDKRMWVYREPLRKSGLEEEFKSRIGKKPVETSSEATDRV